MTVVYAFQLFKDKIEFQQGQKNFINTFRGTYIENTWTVIIVNKCTYLLEG